MGLLYGENCIILTSNAFDWSTRVTDRQTELPWHIHAIAYMLSRVKRREICTEWHTVITGQQFPGTTTCYNTYHLIYVNSDTEIRQAVRQNTFIKDDHEPNGNKKSQSNLGRSHVAQPHSPDICVCYIVLPDLPRLSQIALPELPWVDLDPHLTWFLWSLILRKNAEFCISAVIINGSHHAISASYKFLFHWHAANCPLCQEEETVLHLLGRCNALSLTRLNHLGSHRMDYNDLSNIRWPLLLKLAKASGRFFVALGILKRCNALSFTRSNYRGFLFVPTPKLIKASGRLF